VATVQQTPGELDDKAYQNLSRETVLPHPITFSKVESGLFMKIVRLGITPGYVVQQQDPKSQG
jgi:COX Aromatic Rich Motif